MKPETGTSRFYTSAYSFQPLPPLLFGGPEYHRFILRQHLSYTIRMYIPEHEFLP